jgi:cytochrome c biogenesis protein CcmG, thiol:disulfide interchange protein DsbE
MAADDRPSPGLEAGEDGPRRAGADTAADVPEVWTARPRGRWLRWTLATVALTAVGAWALVAGSRLGQDATQVQSPLLGEPAPSFELPLLDGGTIDSADLQGQAYVVNFWASWCVPCREEAPVLQAFHERWSDRGVRLIGVVYQDTASKAEGFRDEFGLTFPQAVDPDGTTAIDFGVFGIPETYVVDERGIVMAKLVGAVGPTTLDDVLAQIRSGQTVTDRNERYRTSPDDD